MEMQIQFSNSFLGTFPLREATSAYSSIQHMVRFYPHFESWYWSKVVPGVVDGSRLVRIVERNGGIVGILVAKKALDEKKLCTLWVADDRAGSGIGVRLIKEGCEWLGTSSPLASVPEERMPEFGNILPRMGFSLTQTIESMYRPGKREFVFNGRLVPLSA